MKKFLMMFVALFTMLLGLASLTSCGNNESTDIIRIGMECNYAPNNWMEQSKTETNYPISNNPGFYAEGYDVQVSKRLAAYLGKELEIVQLEWGGLITSLQNNDIDLIIAGMADTAERKESIDFTSPYWSDEYCIVVRKDSKYTSATSIADFSGAALQGQVGTLLDTYIDQISNVNHLNPADTVSSMVYNVNASVCDGIVLNYATALPYLNSYNQLSTVRFEAGNGFSMAFTGACVGVRKNDIELRDTINTFLQSELTQEVRQELMTSAQNNMPA